MKIAKLIALCLSGAITAEIIFTGCSSGKPAQSSSNSIKYLREREITYSSFKPNILFRSGMVLQCDAAVPVWGVGPEGKEVSLEFNGQTKKTTVKGGKWQINLDPMKVVSNGIPMVLSCGDIHIKLRDILVGEVWLISGQSNMCFYVDYLQEPTKSNIVDDFNYPKIRFFTQKEVKSENPQSEAEEGKWATANPLDVGKFSTLGALFSRGLYKELKVPIGIITAAYGGTRMESFISDKRLEDSKLPLAEHPDENVYNAMINPLKPFRFRGMLWYQGEANCFYLDHIPYYSSYTKLLVEQFREEFENPDMPFIQVQLPSYSMPNDADFTEIRFEQMKAETMIPNVYTTINYDTGNPKDIHPSDKLPVGARLTSMALEKVYHKDLKNLYPAFEKAEVNGNSVIVTFKDVDKGLEILDKKVTGLELCGADDVYHQANAEIVSKNQLKVTSDEVNVPKGIHYGCQSNMKPAQFFDKNSYPVKPFKTEL